MINIDFEEPETFQTPDKRVWIVNPLKRRDLKKINGFINLNKQMENIKSEGKADEVNKIMFGEDEDNEDELTLLKIADDLIDASIEEKETGERFPDKYRRQIKKLIELTNIVIKASTGNIEGSKGSDTPLPEKNRKSKSGPATISSTKKQAGKKK